MEENFDISMAAADSFLKVMTAAEEKNVLKAALAFYDIVKKTRGLAKTEGVLEKEKDQINKGLSNSQAMITMMLVVAGWRGDQIKEFEDKVDELWIKD